MRILASAALLSVERRATAQKANSFTVAYLALLPGEDRMNFAAMFVRRLKEFGYVDGCVYQKIKAARSDGEVRLRWRANL
jgi:putative ABC transport system substrate-binding protein